MTTTPASETAGPQPGVDDPELWKEGEIGAAELVSVGAPLLNRVREELGKPVVIHIIGGMQCAGRLNDVDEEDGVLTLMDGAARYYVALHAIAVLVTK